MIGRFFDPQEAATDETLDIVCDGKPVTVGVTSIGAGPIILMLATRKSPPAENAS